MVHLFLHLATEAKIGGPVQYRWMYPIERLLRRFKCYVRNKSRPEGSIAEGYIIEECMYFCSKYLNEIETKFNQPERNDDAENDDYKGLSIFASSGVPLGKAKCRSLSEEELTQVREYVLKNYDEAQTYLESFELVQCFNGILANGFRFHTKNTEMKRVHQNSGVTVKDIARNMEKDYYRILTNILEIQYLDGKRVVLFHCDWWDVNRVGRGVKVDKHGNVSVNSLCSLRTKEPFVLMSQAQQVFYVSDGLDPDWLVVVKTHPRHHYNFVEKEGTESEEDALQQLQSEGAHISSSNDGYVPTNDELEDQEREIEPQIRFTRKANIRHLREGNKKGNFIPPNSVAKFLKTNKKAQNTMAMDILEKGKSDVNSLIEICW
uniref:DUF4218 domain-containing protein n=1 Tax=Chenopodium quinoa TaxID=63459 RepID=A0A803MY00_CHEQI